MATEVTVVRPRLSTVTLVSLLGSHFLRAWIIMLVVGAVVPQLELSYFHALLAYFAVRALIPSGEYLNWTKMEAKSHGQ